VTTRGEATQAARPLDRRVGRGRIVEGAGIFQDHRFGEWPQCCPPRSEYEGDEYQYCAKDPDMVFDVEWNGRYWNCKADGYGYLRSRGESGEYGSGSILVQEFDGVELVTPNATVRNSAPLESVEARYKDLLQRIGAQGHDGAIAEIAALRKASGIDA